MELRDLVARFESEGPDFLDPDAPFLLQKTLDEANQAGAQVVALNPRAAPLLVGRASVAGLRIQSPNVSSKHAKLLPPGDAGSAWRVVDMGSTNGTFLGEKELAPHDSTPLRDRDTVRFGPSARYLFMHPKTLRALLAKSAQATAPASAGSSNGSARASVEKPPQAARPPKRTPPKKTPAPQSERAPKAEAPPGKAKQPPPARPPRAEAPPGKTKGPPQTQRGGSLPADFLKRLLADTRAQDASDLHLTAGLPPIMRINGELTRRSKRALSADEIASQIPHVTSPEQLDRFTESGDLDTCVVVGEDRYRVNACRQRDGSSLTFRVIPRTVPSLTELGVPSEAVELTKFAQGLVLITGPLGAGKTTTLFSLVDVVNQTRKEHIITIEDPVEFILPGKLCQVAQRERGTHTASFGAALRGALREDPDIIVIGDLRDYETASLAISAAETGHLVFASMATMNAMKSIDKLIDLFPAGEQATTRTMFSESLRGILCQRLLPGLEGKRVLAVELVFNSIAVANIIREGNTAALKNAMQVGRSSGMRSLEFSLEELVKAKKISKQTADAVKAG